MLLIKEHVENLAIALQKYYTYKSLKSRQGQMHYIADTMSALSNV